MKTALLIVIVLALVLSGAALTSAQSNAACAGETVRVVNLSEAIPLYSAADAASQQVGAFTLINGQEWTRMSQSGDWANVCLPDNVEAIGYTPVVFLEVVQQPTPSPEATAEVVVNASSYAAPPTDLRELPSAMMSGMAYVDPADNCRDVAFDGATCSSYEGQSRFGNFALEGAVGRVRPGARVATGDVISFRWTAPAGYNGMVFRDEANNTVLYPEMSELTGSNAYVVVLMNSSNADVPLTYNAPHGSFIGEFHLAITNTAWTPALGANLRDLHIRYMMVESQPALDAWLEAEDDDADGPYPQLNPANCSSVRDLEQNEVTYCDVVNVVEMTWDGTVWTFNSFGAFGIDRTTGQGIWIDLSSVLPELVAQ